MMKDEDKFKERYSLLLDNRQIFLFFFASAVILSLVFLLGLVVGRRMDSSAAVQPASDPLALLDQMSKDEAGDENLTFHEALVGEGHKKARPAAKKQAKPAPPTPAKAKPDAGPVAPVPAKEEQDPPVAKAVAEPPQEQPKPAAAKPAADGTFTLQLSAFQDKMEAKQFMQNLQGNGLKPYMVPAKIPNRGVWYRVRVGSYATWDEALAAKQAFEKKQQIIAYVARIGQ